MQKALDYISDSHYVFCTSINDVIKGLVIMHLWFKWDASTAEVIDLWPNAHTISHNRKNKLQHRKARNDVTLTKFLMGNTS